MKKTLWQDLNSKIHFETQKENIECDILIIGGGMAGISTAFELKECKQKVVLIDKGKIGYCVSSRSTGKLTYSQELIYHKLEAIFDFDTAKKYYESQKMAIEIAENRILNYKIDCNFEKVSSYVFTNQKKDLPKFKKEEEFLKKVNCKYKIVHNLPIPFPMCYGIEAPDTAVFHPVKYILGQANILKDKISIYENTLAETLTKEDSHYIVKTNRGFIKAKIVVVCTHYPFFINPGFIPLRTHLEKDYVIASKVNQTYPFSAITPSLPIHSIRFHHDQNNYLIYCGNSLKTNQGLNEKEEHQKLEKEFEEYFQLSHEYLWSTHDIMTNDFLPFIGRLQKKNPNLFVATGFNTWGMTNGILAGKILSDLILKNENEWEELFSPERKINWKKIKSFFSDGYQNASSIIKSKVNKKKSFYSSSVSIENENGQSIGIYKDENGIEHKIRNLCPHMKCSFIFNEYDKTWDCPCHGSRFDIDGHLLEGPSVYPIQKDNQEK